MSDESHEKLMNLRTGAWDYLASKYPDESAIAFIRDLDSRIAAIVVSDAPVITRAVSLPAKHKRKRDARGDLIEEVSVKIFSEQIKSPAFAHEIAPVLRPALRKAGVDLPDDDKKASGILGGIYSKRPEIFKKFPGDSESKKAATRWHLQPS